MFPTKQKFNFPPIGGATVLPTASFLSPRNDWMFTLKDPRDGDGQSVLMNMFVTIKMEIFFYVKFSF